MIALLAALAPFLLAAAAVATVWVNRRINTKTAERGDFDSIVAGYKGLWEQQVEYNTQLATRLGAVEGELVLVKATVVILQAENVALKIRLKDVEP